MNPPGKGPKLTLWWCTVCHDCISAPEDLDKWATKRFCLPCSGTNDTLIDRIRAESVEHVKKIVAQRHADREVKAEKRRRQAAFQLEQETLKALGDATTNQRFYISCGHVSRHNGIRTECKLESGHGGDHIDALGRSWAGYEYKHGGAIDTAANQIVRNMRERRR